MDLDDKEEEDVLDVETALRPPSIVKDPTTTAQELLGTDDPIIHRAVGNRARVMHEFAQSPTLNKAQRRMADAEVGEARNDEEMAQDGTEG